MSSCFASTASRRTSDSTLGPAPPSIFERPETTRCSRCKRIISRCISSFLDAAMIAMWKRISSLTRSPKKGCSLSAATILSVRKRIASKANLIAERSASVWLTAARPAAWLSSAKRRSDIYLNSFRFIFLTLAPWMKPRTFEANQTGAPPGSGVISSILAAARSSRSRSRYFVRALLKAEFFGLMFAPTSSCLVR